MYDIIIVGAGAAGLSAAVYALRAEKKVLVFESTAYGGQIVTSPEVENYPALKKVSGYEFAEKLYNQAAALGLTIRQEKVAGMKEGDGCKEIITEEGSYPCRAVILATGAKSRQLGLPREEGLTGRGVSYCAACDGAFFKGMPVAVAGGGNTAVEEAIFLSGYCSKVYVINRGSAFKGEQSLVKSLQQKENVEFLFNSNIVELEGEERLAGIRLKNSEDGQESSLQINGLFVAIGLIPQNEAFSGLVDLDENGYILAGEDCKTNVPGVFAAGDCRAKGVRQLTTAAADGAVAALGACEFIG